MVSNVVIIIDPDKSAAIMPTTITAIIQDKLTLLELRIQIKPAAMNTQEASKPTESVTE